VDEQLDDFHTHRDTKRRRNNLLDKPERVHRLSDRTWQPTDSLDYNITLDLGAYGIYVLVGSLLGPQTLLRFRTIVTTHFNISVPDVRGKVGQRFDKIASFFEQAYEAESSAIGQGLVNKVRVEFPIDIIAGVAGSNYVGMASGFSLDMSYRTIPSTFIGVATHELGHVFQLSSPLQPPGWYVASWFGEPSATWLGNMAIQEMLSPRHALYDRGKHDNFYLDLLRGAPTKDALIENIQFVMFLMQRWYGRDVLKEFVRLWTSKGVGSILASRGYNVNESVVSTFSAVVGTNMAAYFRLAGLDVSDDRIGAGMQAVLTAIAGENQSQPPSLVLFTPQVNGSLVSVNGVTLPSTPGSMVVRISWDWGDGCSEESWFPASHTYDRSDNFTITVTSYQSDGQRTTREVGVVIAEGLTHEVSFDIDPRQALGPYILMYIDGVSYGAGDLPRSFYWAHGTTHSVRVEISPTMIQKDLFTNYVFEGWTVAGTIVSTSPSYSFAVTGPISLTAGWKTELNVVTTGAVAGVAILLIAAVVLLMSRRSRSAKANKPRTDSLTPS